MCGGVGVCLCVCVCVCVGRSHITIIPYKAVPLWLVQVGVPLRVLYEGTLQFLYAQ